jgi:regulator of protease activity HflC (stomatin/prohibitin superfamily)
MKPAALTITDPASISRDKETTTMSNYNGENRYEGTDGAAEMAAMKAEMRAAEAMAEAKAAMQQAEAQRARAAKEAAEIEAAAERAAQQYRMHYGDSGSGYTEVRTDNGRVTSINTRGRFDSRADAGVTMAPPAEVLRDVVVKAHGVEVSYEQATYMLSEDQLAAAADDAMAKRGLPFRFR